MKSKKKTLRNNHIWFSIWNAKSLGVSPKCNAQYRPTKTSER